MRNPAFFASLFAALVGLSPVARAATLKAWEDTSSAKGKITLPANKASTLVIGENRHGFVYFDLTEIPDGAVVRYARLRLYFPSVSRAGFGISLHSVTSDWNEGVASSAPTFSETPLATFAPEAIGNKRFASMDVTETVTGWLENRASNQGFALAAVSGSPRTKIASLKVNAKEGSGTGYPAELEVELLNPGTGSGEITNEQLPANLTLAGVTTGHFSGNGAGLTNLASTAMKVTEPGVGAVARTVQAKWESLPLSVRDFGAIGDGATDDTGKLQAAIAAADAQGRPLYIPPGTYKLTAALNIPTTGMWIFGAGGDRTVLRQTVSGESAMTFTTNVNQVCIERIKFQGNGAGTHTVPGIITPASTNNIDHFILRDLDVRGFSLGIQLQDVANAHIERVLCFNNANGMRVLGNSNAVHYNSCAWVENSGYGLRLEGGKGHLISTGEFGGPLQTSGQIIMAGAGSLVVNGMNMEVHGGDAIQHTVASATLVLNNVFVGGFGGSGYSLVMGQNLVTVNNCLFSHHVSLSTVKQTHTYACSLTVWGGTLKVDAFSGASLFGSYQTNPLVNLSELQPSGQSAAAGTGGSIQRRIESGALEAWYGTLRKADGSYEYVSLTPLRTANTWALPQTFSVGVNITSGGLTVVGNILGGGDLRAGAASYIYWTGRSSMKSTADGSISFRNQSDTLDASISAANLTLSGGITLPKTITAGGTTGARTINQPSGSVNFAAAATSLVLTNSLITTNSVVQVTVASNDANKPYAWVVQGAGSATIYLSTAPAGEVRVNFRVTN